MIPRKGPWGKDPLDYIHPEAEEPSDRRSGDLGAGTNPGTPTEFRIRTIQEEYIDVETIAINMLDVLGDQRHCYHDTADKPGKRTWKRD